MIRRAFWFQCAFATFFLAWAGHDASNLDTSGLAVDLGAFVLCAGYAIRIAKDAREEAGR